MNARAAAMLERVKLDLDVQQPLGACSIAVQQLIAIARASTVRRSELLCI